MRLRTILAAPLFAGLMTITLTGCGGSDSPESTDAVTDAATDADASTTTAPAITPITPKPAEWTPSDDPRTASFLGFSAPKPTTWIEHPPKSSMRAANYSIPGVDGHDAAELVVFQGIGSSIEANIGFWANAFTTDDGNPVIAQTEQIEVNGMPVTLVELAGNYQSRAAVSPTPDMLFLGAGVEAPGGNIYIRIVGPTGTVEANREAFQAMIEGLHPSDSAGG